VVPPEILTILPLITGFKQSLPMKNDLIYHNEIVDSILNTHSSALGSDHEQYRNHVYRVLNFALPLVDDAKENETMMIAAAFHDLGIWTNRTFDYLQPSVNLAKRYSADHQLSRETDEAIESIILNHHKIFRFRGPALTEIFRQADLVDLSLGLIRCGRSRDDIRRVRKVFPNKGFHRNLTRLFLKNLFRTPWKPLPMYRF
jgi:hypothetical protein